MTNTEQARLDRHLRVRLSHERGGGTIPYAWHIRTIAARLGLTVEQVQDRLAELKQPPVETTWNN